MLTGLRDRGSYLHGKTLECMCALSVLGVLIQGSQDTPHGGRCTCESIAGGREPFRDFQPGHKAAQQLFTRPEVWSHSGSDQPHSDPESPYSGMARARCPLLAHSCAIMGARHVLRSPAAFLLALCVGDTHTRAGLHRVVC